MEKEGVSPVTSGTEQSETLKKHPLANCNECTLKNETYVPSFKPVGAKLAIVGLSPGGHEAQAGRPFVGASGKLLRAVLAEHGLDLDASMLTNVVSCRPPSNAEPTKLEISCCSERLKFELEESNAEQILCLGKVAANNILSGKTGITRLRIGPPKFTHNYPNKEIVPTFHPAACLRSSDTFPSLVADVKKLVTKAVVRNDEPKYTVIERSEDVSRLVQELAPYSERLVVDIETARDKDVVFEHPSQTEILCVGIGYAPGKVVVVSKEALEGNGKYILGEYLGRSKITAHNGKFDVQGIRSFSPRARLYFDTMLASYCDDERQGTNSLGFLTAEILGADNHKDLMEPYKNDFGKAPRDLLHRYNAIDCVREWELEDHYRNVLTPELVGLHDRLVRASNALVPVELEGIHLDMKYLAEVEAEYQQKMDDQELQLSRWVKNPRSPMQIMAVLREQFEIATETTDKAFLEWAVKNYTYSKTEAALFCRYMLEYRKTQKLYSTYIKGARQREYGGRLYPSFLLHGTVTGRLSCRNPNLFNIPRGSSIRKLFTAEPGKIYLYGDFSQIQLRILGCLAEDKYLRDVFSDPSRDIHSEIGARLGIPRQEAKVIAYGVSFGMEAGHLANLTGMPINLAGSYLREFFRVIPGVVRWKKALRKSVLTDSNDLVTPYGRHRRYWLITDENQKDIIKEATAFWAQAIEADICLDAHVALLEAGYKVRLSVYDSIMIECDPAEADEIEHIMRKTMIDSATNFSDFLPFTVDVKRGDSWGVFG